MTLESTRKHRTRRPTARKAWTWGLVSVFLAGGLLAASELVFYFPLTSFQLASAARRRLPPRKQGLARLVFVGDILLGDAGRAILEKRGYDYPLKALSPWLKACDAAIGNLEGPIAVEAKRNRWKRWAYKMAPQAARALSRAGLTAVTLANNHILDCGPGGIAETEANLDKVGVRFFGAGRNQEEARRPLVLQLQGIRVALLGYLAPYQLMAGRMASMAHLGAGPSRPGAALAGTRAFRRDIAHARSRADLVIVFLHMGDRYQNMPTEFEQALAHEALDRGADAVLACGTHILGPLERYRGKPIVYSLGNFTFGTGNFRARFSQMAFLDVSRRGVESLFVAPIYTVNWNPMVWFQPKLLVGWKGARVIHRLSGLSGRLGTRLHGRGMFGWLD